MNKIYFFIGWYNGIGRLLIYISNVVLFVHLIYVRQLFLQIVNLLLSTLQAWRLTLFDYATKQGKTSFCPFLFLPSLGTNEHNEQEHKHNIPFSLKFPLGFTMESSPTQMKELLENITKVWEEIETKDLPQEQIPHIKIKMSEMTA